MKEYFTTKTLCRAGVIAALYVALTYAFGALSYQGFIEIRPAEALTVLPLFFPEAVPALWVGCMLANLGSPFLMYDVPLGGLATLIAALGTYAAGRLIKNDIARLAVGGLFPVLVNAFVIPGVIILCEWEELVNQGIVVETYWLACGSLCATQALWVYVLGAPLYFAIRRLRDRGVSVLSSPVPVTGDKSENDKKVPKN